jgi:hypothetical protein
MNVKPGDLARVVGQDAPENNDRLVEVLRPAFDPYWWCCLPLSPVLAVEQGGRERWAERGEKVYIHDSCLRPIRDPGDDAVDEISLRRPITRQPEHC